jgi:hypothetical protein
MDHLRSDAVAGEKSDVEVQCISIPWG